VWEGKGGGGSRGNESNFKHGRGQPNYKSSICRRIRGRGCEVRKGSWVAPKKIGTKSRLCSYFEMEELRRERGTPKGGGGRIGRKESEKRKKASPELP